jgi:hypothetical protein
MENMEMSESVENVFNRMMRLTDRELDAGEIESIKRGIKQCLDNGFTETEAVRHCRCFEEYNPDLAEDVALSRMAAITREVEERTGVSYRNGRAIPHRDIDSATANAVMSEIEAES